MVNTYFLPIILLLCFSIFSCNTNQKPISQQDSPDEPRQYFGESPFSPNLETEEDLPEVEKMAARREYCKRLEELFPNRKYFPFRDEIARSVNGFGIYYDKAEVNISESGLLVDHTEEGNVLKVDYELNPYYSWGNFLSLRREFEKPQNLSKCKGLEIELKVKRPSSAKLRITLADVSSPFSKWGSDELWWADLNVDMLKVKGEWITLQIPFEDFKISYGYGTRHNNYEQDFNRIIAYEVNVLSGPHDRVKGAFLIKSIKTYTQSQKQS